jgi:hypothetical protein
MRKSRNVILSEESWKIAKRAANKTIPKTTRPSWIDHAIQEQAKREGVK